MSEGSKTSNYTELVVSIAQALLDNISQDQLALYLEPYFDAGYSRLLISNKRTISMVTQMAVQEIVEEAVKTDDFKEIAEFNFQNTQKYIKLSGLLRNLNQVFQWLTTDSAYSLLSNFSHEEIKTAFELNKTIKIPTFGNTIIHHDQPTEAILQDGKDCFVAWVLRFTQPTQRLLLTLSNMIGEKTQHNIEHKKTLYQLFEQVAQSDTGGKYGTL